MAEEAGLMIRSLIPMSFMEEGRKIHETKLSDHEHVNDVLMDQMVIKVSSSINEQFMM
ncbi:hypothetical protein NOM01_07200 [Sporolactobacillus sp. STSJ-5]|uniref:hypothetical protein n=1 Tax=Sporolactobacillus sp. STSJ-5 TaxID=2965076 RepID=UPI002107518B|nr:hypothetical protein [Sporolactobacillus sp. STSJ-5]MCQ2009790.1 hypothetical protein [Sporolactobacillus sp. STSJ-5]